MSKNKTNYNQELSLGIQLEKYGDFDYYFFTVESKYYYENNVDVKYYLLYHKRIYISSNFFNMKKMKSINYF